MTVPSVWSRLLWRNEEAKAHVAGLETARHLGLPLSSGPLAGWWFEYLVWYWPAATLLLSGLTSLFCFHLVAEYIKQQAVQKAAPPSANPIAARPPQQQTPTPASL